MNTIAYQSMRTNRPSAGIKTAVLFVSFVLATGIGVSLHAQSLPELAIKNSVLLEWPVPAEDCIVVRADSLTNPVWIPCPEPIFKRHGELYMAVSINTNQGEQYFKLVPGLQFIDDFDPLKEPFTSRNDWMPLFFDPGDTSRFAIAIAADLDPVLVGQYPPYGEGSVQAIAISGDYAYVAFGGAGLQILDIRDPAKPRRVGVYDVPGNVEDVSVQGHYAYVHVENAPELQVIDVSNPAAPRRVASYSSEQQFADGADLAVSGKHACLRAAQRIELIDLSNPQRPSLDSISDFEGTGGAVAFGAAGNLLCVAGPVGKLEMIDISDPAHPQRLGACNLLTNPYGGSVVVYGRYAYVGGTGLTIVDISDPVHPRAVGAIDGIAPGMGSQVAVSGNLAVMAGDALTVIDVSDPTNPGRVGQLALKRGATVVALSGNHAYVGDRLVGVQVIDVSDPGNPRFVGEYRYSNLGASAVAVSGDLACVRSWSRSLQLIDVSNPSGPMYVSEYKTDGAITHVRTMGDFAHVLVGQWDETEGIHYHRVRYETVDVSNPAHPQRVGAAEFDDSTDAWTDLEILGNYAYVTGSWQVSSNRFSGLLIIDVTDVAHPTRVGISSTDWPPLAVAVADRYACVVGNDRGLGHLQVIDVSDPVHPQRASEYVLSESVAVVAMAGRYVYLGVHSGNGSDAKLLVIDVSNPAVPQPLGSCPVEKRWGLVWELAVSGRYACMAVDYDGVLVFDVSDPTHPRRVGRWATRAQTLSLAIAGRYIYAADSTWETSFGGRYPEGLVILDLGNPACLQRLGSVEIPRGGDEVQRSTDGVAVAGQHTLVFSTGAECGEAFGVYSCSPSTNLVHSIDTSDPAHPQRVGQGEMSGGGGFEDASIVTVDRTAYVVDGSPTLNVIDLSDPVQPRRVREIDLGQNGTGMAVSGGYVYVVANNYEGHGRLQVLGTPALTPVGILPLSKDCGSGIAVAAGHAYVAGVDLEIIDISQPTNPRRVGGCPGLGGGWEGRVAVTGGRAYVLGDGLLRVFALTVPEQPQLLGECVVPPGGMRGYSGGNIVLAEGYAYVANAGAGVEVFDIRDPAHPRRVGGNSAFDAHALAIADGRLYVAAGEQGLVVLNLYQPPQLDSLHLDAEGFHLLLHGVTGQMMRLDRSRDLRTWEPFATVPILARGQTLIDPAATAEPHLFYRAVVP